MEFELQVLSIGHVGIVLRKLKLKGYGNVRD
jgi:hypothetical protein